MTRCRITAYLQGLGLDAYGVDLPPAMIEVARRDNPGLRFEVGSMTRLDLVDDCLTGLLAWFCLIHVPDDEVSVVLVEFRRVLRPGGGVLLGFHAGDGSGLKAEGYGGHAYVHRRPPDRVAAWLYAAETEVIPRRTAAPQ